MLMRVGQVTASPKIQSRNLKSSVCVAVVALGQLGVVFFWRGLRCWIEGGVLALIKHVATC